MIRYQADFGRDYFVEYFRSSFKMQSRVLEPVPDAPPVSISVVTTCMNRLHDLKRTLPQNLADNATYPNAEFVLLDYGSKDGLEDWAKTELASHIQSGRLVYYRSEKQPFFRPNHSRNVSFRLAQNDIVVNVDADNFMHVGFLDAVRQCAVREKVLIVPNSFLNPNSPRFMLRGRFGLFRKDLLGLGGFDEDLDSGYSHDDVSLVLRAMLSGFSLCRFDDKYIADRIETPMHQRRSLMRRTDDASGTNAQITKAKLTRCAIKVNRGKNWGAAKVVKNFSDEIAL